MYSIISFYRGWLCSQDVADAAGIVFDHSRRVVHSPYLMPAHHHNFMFDCKYPSNFPHLYIKDGIQHVVRLMLKGNPYLAQPYGYPDRDRMIQRAFLERNSASKVIQIDFRGPENMVPGGCFLLESLITESKESRYAIPSSHFLETFRQFRSVDQNSLNQVLAYFI